MIGEVGFLLQHFLPFFLLGPGKPDALIRQNFVRGEGHGRNDICHISKQGMCKNRHKTDLAIGKLEHVPNLRRTAKQSRLHSNSTFHFPLVCEFLLKQIRPLLGDMPRSGLLGQQVSYRVLD